MKAKLDAERQAEELEKAKEQELEDLKKAKIEADKQLEEMEVIKAKAKADAEELEVLKKAKDARETAEFIQKAKDLKADDADAFGMVLKKCKSVLEDAEFEALEKQLGKLKNVTKAKDAGDLDNLGESNAEKLVKSKDERIAKRRAELISEGVMRHEASKKARTEVEAELAKAQ